MIKDNFELARIALKFIEADFLSKDINETAKAKILEKLEWIHEDLMVLKSMGTHIENIDKLFKDECIITDINDRER